MRLQCIYNIQLKRTASAVSPSPRVQPSRARARVRSQCVCGRYRLQGVSLQNTLIGGRSAGACRRWKLANRRPPLHAEASSQLPVQ